MRERVSGKPSRSMPPDGCLFMQFFWRFFTLRDLDWICLPENLRSQGCERGAYKDVFMAIFRQTNPVQVSVPGAIVNLFY
jgi:hypothetical protein